MSTSPVASRMWSTSLTLPSLSCTGRAPSTWARSRTCRSGSERRSAGVRARLPADRANGRPPVLQPARGAGKSGFETRLMPAGPTSACAKNNRVIGPSRTAGDSAQVIDPRLANDHHHVGAFLVESAADWGALPPPTTSTFFSANADRCGGQTSADRPVGRCRNGSGIRQGRVGNDTTRRAVSDAPSESVS